MKAESNVYIALQNIYKAKARKDAAKSWSWLQAAAGDREIDPAEVELFFCKNAAFVKLVNMHGVNGDSADRLSKVAGESCSFARSRVPLLKSPPTDVCRLPRGGKNRDINIRHS